jgi:hypothetical protein
MRGVIFASVIVAFCCAFTGSVQAATVVVTPNTDANQPGTNSINSPFGANSSSNLYVLQVQYDASMFGGVAMGSQLTSIGFRLAPGSTTNSEALTYDDFSIQVGSAANAIGSLSRTFSSNLGSDTILARTGALTIGKGQFPADACTRSRCKPMVPTNSFYTIDLTTPYTYEGGDLLVTFSSELAASTIGQIIALDAVDPLQVSTVSTVATLGNGSSFPTKTSSPVNFAFAPILQFSFESPISGAVPEPAAWAMMLAGFGLVGGAMRRQRRISASIA